MNDISFPLETKRHSLAHLLAQAVQRYVDPRAQLGTGPATDNGAYYDIGFGDGIEFGEKKLKDLTKNIKQLVKEPQTYVLYECAIDEGPAINALTSQTLKDELIAKFKSQGETNISYYLNVVPAATLDNLRNTQDGYIDMYQSVTQYFQDKGTISLDQAVVFIDLCAGPHVNLTKEDIDPNGIKLEKLAGAYWQADENNQMMTRLYLLAFENKEDLQAYETMMAEARKRDHRLLGQQLDLFTFDDEVGPGTPTLATQWCCNSRRDREIRQRDGEQLRIHQST